MTAARDLAGLLRLAMTFGPEVPARKLAALEGLAARKHWSARGLAALHDVLCFLRAYPDDARVLAAVNGLIAALRDRLADSGIDPETARLENRGIPGTVNRYSFTYPVLSRLMARHPACLEIDWDGFGDMDRLAGTLTVLVMAGECQGLDDIALSLPEWFSRCRGPEDRSDLRFLMHLFEHAPMIPAVRDQVFEDCGIPVRYELREAGTARCEVASRVGRVHYQRRPLDRQPGPIEQAIRRVFRKAPLLGLGAARAMIDVADRALAARCLEIRTLAYANPRDVTLLDCGRGIQVALIGVVPSYRDPIESHYCALILKNGVPVAYGPSTVSLGCCELGLNLFPEFRGAEVRFIYPQFMRAIHQVLGAEHFYLTAYGMGEGNPAAIRTGAFWFYRKLGFRPLDPKLDALARAEEARMARDPRHRSGAAMLRRLSHTSVFLDISPQGLGPPDFGALGVRQSRFVAKAFGGDRRRARAAARARVARALERPETARGPADAHPGWDLLAPTLVMIPDLASWPLSDRRRLARILDVKGAPSERHVDGLIRRHRRLCCALQALAGPLETGHAPRDPATAP